MTSLQSAANSLRTFSSRSVTDSMDWGLHCWPEFAIVANTDAMCSGELDTEPRMLAGKGAGTSPSSVMPMS